jgi:fatty acid desaturase
MDDFQTACARPRLKAAELLQPIPSRTRRRSYLPGLFVFCLDYFGYFLGSIGACLVPTWWGKLLSSALAAFSIGGLFIVGHDAAHSSLVPSRRLNRLAASGLLPVANAAGSRGLLVDSHLDAPLSALDSTVAAGRSCRFPF